MLNKSFITQMQLAQVVMATFLGSDDVNSRYEAGTAVALIWSLDPLKLHNYFKKNEMHVEATKLLLRWFEVRPDWAYWEKNEG